MACPRSRRSNKLVRLPLSRLRLPGDQKKEIHDCLEARQRPSNIIATTFLS
jgi:hypothetical protein